MADKNFRLSEDQVQELAPGHGAGFATDRIMVDGIQVSYCYREKPDFEEDSGWRFFAGDEDQAYIDNPENIGLYDINVIANYDPDIIPLLDADIESTFERDTEGDFVQLIFEDDSKDDATEEDRDEHGA